MSTVSISFDPSDLDSVNAAAKVLRHFQTAVGIPTGSVPPLKEATPEDPTPRRHAVPVEPTPEPAAAQEPEVDLAAECRAKLAKITGELNLTEKGRAALAKVGLTKFRDAEPPRSR